MQISLLIRHVLPVSIRDACGCFWFCFCLNFDSVFRHSSLNSIECLFFVGLYPTFIGSGPIENGRFRRVSTNCRIVIQTWLIVLARSWYNKYLNIIWANSWHDIRNAKFSKIANIFCWIIRALNRISVWVIIFCRFFRSIHMKSETLRLRPVGLPQDPEHLAWLWKTLLMHKFCLPRVENWNV